MQLQGVAIILSSIIVRSVVNLVLTLTQPPQPNGCFSDEAAAFAFARDKCTEVKVWTPARKLRRQATTQERGRSSSMAEAKAPRRWMSFGGGSAASEAASAAADGADAQSPAQTTDPLSVGAASSDMGTAKSYLVPPCRCSASW